VWFSQSIRIVCRLSSFKDVMEIWIYLISYDKGKGRAMAQAVSSRLLTAEALVRAPVSSAGISDEQSGTGQGFS
jgi:hypothetical protein